MRTLMTVALTARMTCLSLLLLMTTAVSAEEPTAAEVGNGPWVTSIAAHGQDQIALATAEGLLLQEATVMLDAAELPVDPQEALKLPSAAWAVTTTADGQHLASTDYRGNLAIHHFADGQTKLHDQAFERWTRAIAFSPDGQKVIGGNEAGKLFVWDIASAKIEKSQELTKQAIMEVIFDPQGQLLAVADGGGSVRLLRWPSLEEAATIQVTDQPVWALAATDSGWLAGAADNKIYQLPAEGGEARELAKLGDWVSDLQLSDSGIVAAAEIGGRVQLLTTAGKKLGPAVEMPSGAWALHWTPAGKLLVGTRKHGIQVVQQSWSVVPTETLVAAKDAAEAEAKAAAEKAAAEKAAAEKAAAEKAAAEKAAAEKAAAEKAAAEKAAAEKAAAEKAAAEKAAAEKAAAEKAAAEKAKGDSEQAADGSKG